MAQVLVLAADLRPPGLPRVYREGISRLTYKKAPALGEIKRHAEVHATRFNGPTMSEAPTPNWKLSPAEMNLKMFSAVRTGKPDGPWCVTCPANVISAKLAPFTNPAPAEATFTRQLCTSSNVTGNEGVTSMKSGGPP